MAAIAAALFARLRSEQAAARRTAQENERLLSEKEQCREALQEARTRSAEQQAAADRTLAAAQTEAARQLAEARAEIRIWSERFETQTAERGKLEKQFTDYFQNLANDILEDKTKRFTETNRQNIGDLLRPLGENLEKFRQRIEQEAAERKVLGDWGEMILETLLESSGLQKGIHFRVQEDFRTEEGAHVRPDVVLLLPGDKQMVIDSKVSLTAYAAYAEADGADGSARKAALAAHVASVRKHIDELAGKSYQKLTSASPDFVIMFVPNEPAFLVALQSDPKLWDDAYRRKVILSSPTNLFAILKIVDDLWRRDNQDRYALEIARQGGALYDKFVGFAENFLAVGDALGRTDKAYRAALGQLREGNGNLVRRAESLRKLGVKAAKKMPAALAPLDDEETAEEADGNVLPDSSSSAGGETGNTDETEHGR